MSNVDKHSSAGQHKPGLMSDKRMKAALVTKIQPNSMASHMKLVLMFTSCLFASFFSHATELSNQLQTGEYVLLMRHTLAPGVGDPPGYTLENCKTQRNLNGEGKQQAAKIGQWLKKQGVKTADVRSSSWCRCKETAVLLKFNGYKTEPALNSFFDHMSSAKEVTSQLQQFIASQMKIKDGKALILVTHHVNIYDFVGENIASGDMVLTRVDSQGKMISYTLIPRPE